ncbi:hypothetical protein M404DRAFT_33197 [Pisolithus tinctorius Marx 270]|uniref:Retrotransposon gag domain-containing protein n=1 Tax=Pisolithus tinctorius Marx 270 TaxID=870435 RepID=A0A0C3NMD7_PISTI|nr:hypothetical protein M404DRAFT_33197 [Pisolithus tinctorius Marx 270]
MDSWRDFILELQTPFSPHDPVADAESQLNHLHEKESQHISKYVVNFNQLASQDEVHWVGKPQTLHELCYLAQEIDAHYWEHKEEVQRASKHQASSSSNKSGSGSNNNHPKTGNNNSSSSPKPASLKPGNNNNNNLSKPEPSTLSKDRKLTPEGCKHHLKGNLCMFCRGLGHFTEKCPKKTRKAKAHATTTTKAALALGLGSTPETKK